MRADNVVELPPPRLVRVACSTWGCGAEAVARLVTPEGTPCRGADVCAVCADVAIEEFRNVAGEHWTVWPLDEHGRPQRPEEMGR